MKRRCIPLEDDPSDGDLHMSRRQCTDRERNGTTRTSDTDSVRDTTSGFLSAESEDRSRSNDDASSESQVESAAGNRRVRRRQTRTKTPTALEIHILLNRGRLSQLARSRVEEEYNNSFLPPEADEVISLLSDETRPLHTDVADPTELQSRKWLAIVFGFKNMQRNEVELYANRLAKFACFTDLLQCAQTSMTVSLAYMSFVNGVSDVTLKNKFKTLIACKPVGNDISNKTFCERFTAYREVGVPTQPKERRSQTQDDEKMTFKKAATVIDTHGPKGLLMIKEADNGFFCANRPRLSKYAGDHLCGTQRRWDVNVYVFFSDDATGKSRVIESIVAELYDEDRSKVFYKADSNWYDNYVGEECIIINDFNNYMSYGAFMTLTDNVPAQVEVKYGYTNIAARNVFISTTKHIDEWWRPTGDGGVQPAFKRRILVFADLGTGEIRSRGVYNPIVHKHLNRVLRLPPDELNVSHGTDVTLSVLDSEFAQTIMSAEKDENNMYVRRVLN